VDALVLAVFAMVFGWFTPGFLRGARDRWLARRRGQHVWMPGLFRDAVMGASSLVLCLSFAGLALAELAGQANAV
jgi:hypothetical protein